MYLNLPFELLVPDSSVILTSCEGFTAKTLNVVPLWFRTADG